MSLYYKMAKVAMPCCLFSIFPSSFLAFSLNFLIPLASFILHKILHRPQDYFATLKTVNGDVCLEWKIMVSYSVWDMKATHFGVTQSQFPDSCVVRKHLYLELWGETILLLILFFILLLFSECIQVHFLQTVWTMVLCMFELQSSVQKKILSSTLSFSFIQPLIY